MSHAEISIFDSLLFRMSTTMDSISSLESFSPSIFLRMDLTESGFWQYTTLTSSPSLTPHLSIRGAGIITTPSSTRVSERLTSATTFLAPVMLTRSFSFTPISRQSLSWRSTVGSDASMS